MYQCVWLLLLQTWFGSRGRGRKGLLLLTPEVIKAIDVLIEHRDKLEINPANQFVFVRTSQQSRENMIVIAWGLWLPELDLKTTISSKAPHSRYMLLLCPRTLTWQVLSSKNIWGIQVHRYYYCLHEATFELAKVSKLPIALDQGKAHQSLTKSWMKLKFRNVYIDTSLY